MFPNIAIFSSFRTNLTRAAVCAVILVACALDAAAAKKISVFIRVDDIFTSTSDIRPIEIDHFLKAAEKHGAKVILATVPNRLLQWHINTDGHMTRALLSAVDRGHQVVQHGYNHMCAFSNKTDAEFSTTESMKMLTQEQRIDKIVEGRRILEAAIGRPVTCYIGPGMDDDVLIPIDEAALRARGFVWLKAEKATQPTILPTGGAMYPGTPDYGWQLTKENYASQMEAAKEYCKKSAENGDAICLKFHEPFTRAGYLDGIVAKHLDELLTWLDAQPEWDIEYVTLDSYYASHGGKPVVAEK